MAWDIMGLGHDETRTQRDWGWDIMEVGHNETGMQWDCGIKNKSTNGLGHNGTRTR